MGDGGPSPGGDSCGKCPMRAHRSDKYGVMYYKDFETNTEQM